jgi:acetyl-CoA C-acetyltransferase
MIGHVRAGLPTGDPIDERAGLSHPVAETGARRANFLRSMKVARVRMWDGGERSSMTATSARTIPVIAAVGEHIDRPQRLDEAREPVDLMVEAMEACEADAGARLIDQVALLSLIGLVSWPYKDPVRLLAQKLRTDPKEAVNASMGGETPVRLVHEAARRIALGDDIVAAIVGGEASHARGQAERAGASLPWTPAASKEETVRFPSSRFAMSPVAKQLGVMNPAQVYPFYEVATQAAWGQTPAEGMRESAELWARYAAVAAANSRAWIRSAPDADAIGTVSADNRLINWPYPKLMVANPAVNQSAAVIVMSLARAREIGIAEDRLIHIWGGASAVEPEDYLHRDRYDRSTAQTAVLEQAVSLAGGDARRLRHLELYSCFPVVPKMALRTLGLDAAEHSPTVAGGLTFFGGPLNNYMSHAIAAMVRMLRQDAGELGLLYGQGGYVNKHHALVLSTTPPPEPMAADYSVQSLADAARGPTPPLHERYTGPAVIETYTVRYARDGAPTDAIIIARTPDGGRVMAMSPASDAGTIDLLTSAKRTAVGVNGRVETDAGGTPVWMRAESET